MDDRTGRLSLEDSLWKFSTGRHENGNKKKQKEIKTREEENEKRGKETRGDVKGRREEKERRKEEEIGRNGLSSVKLCENRKWQKKVHVEGMEEDMTKRGDENQRKKKKKKKKRKKKRERSERIVSRGESKIKTYMFSLLRRL